jgi:catechol 2,3-dioxygenase-like lactoylglutathione lyase family enzyme
MGDGGGLGKVSLAAPSLYVADVDAAVEWYRDKLGLEPVARGKDAHPYVSYHLGGIFFALEPLEAALDADGLGRGSTTINLLTERDPAEVHAKLTKRGVKCTRLVESPHYSSFLIRDLDGNRFYVSRPTTDQGRDEVGYAAERTGGT